MLVAQESWRAPRWPGTAKPQYSASPSRSVQALRSLQRSTTDAGAAQFITVAAKPTCLPVYVCVGTLLLLRYCASISNARI